MLDFGWGVEVLGWSALPKVSDGGLRRKANLLRYFTWKAVLVVVAEYVLMRPRDANLMFALS